MREITLLALPPRGLGLFVGVGAGFDDGRNSPTERGLDVVGVVLVSSIVSWSNPAMAMSSSPPASRTSDDTPSK